MSKTSQFVDGLVVAGYMLFFAFIAVISLFFLAFMVL